MVKKVFLFALIGFTMGCSSYNLSLKKSIPSDKKNFLNRYDGINSKINFNCDMAIESFNLLNENTSSCLKMFNSLDFDDMAYRINDKTEYGIALDNKNHENIIILNDVIFNIKNDTFIVKKEKISYFGDVTFIPYPKKIELEDIFLSLGEIKIGEINYLMPTLLFEWQEIGPRQQGY